MENETGGYIQVVVSTADGAFPVEGALVYISGDSENGENGIIYSLRTDSSGQTEKVRLPAPSDSLSQEPGQVRPYATYNIQVSKENYETVENVSVPVFDGITSLQKVNLIPEQEYAYLSPGYPDQFREVFPAPESATL